MLPLLMFVHGVGPVRDIQADRSAWIAALADGARQAGHSRFANEVLSRVDVRFVHYADLFAPPDAAHAQGDIAMASAQLSGGAAFIASELLAGAVDEQLARKPAPAVRLPLERAKAQLGPAGQAQGSGDVGRRLLSAAMTLLDIPAIRRGAQWLSGMELLGHFAQAGRYLARGERDREGRTLDNRVRERVLAAMSDRPTVVVAHSLGSLVAVEALHEQTREVTLLGRVL